MHRLSRCEIHGRSTIRVPEDISNFDFSAEEVRAAQERDDLEEAILAIFLQFLPTWQALMLFRTLDQQGVQQTLTIKEVAQCIGETPARVSILRARAIATLRKHDGALDVLRAWIA